MNIKSEKRLQSLVEHLSLKIEYLNDLPDNVPGFLQPGEDPRFIFVNARMSRSDQAFTITHELAHYVMHVGRPPCYYLPRYLNWLRRSERTKDIADTTERFMRRKFNIEWQADLWGFIMLWQIGAVDDLLALKEAYPEKRWMFWYSFAATLHAGIKRRLASLFLF
jgi:hypothetical protein